MAAKGTDVSNFAGLAFLSFNSTAEATSIGVNTVAHGLTVTPNRVIVVPSGGAQTITLVSVDATNVNYTSSTNDPVQILAF